MPKPRRSRQGKDPEEQMDHLRRVQTQLDQLAAEGPIPQLWVFDLDYTLWDFWCDTHIDPPIRRAKDSINLALDVRGAPIQLYDDAPAILQWLHSRRDVQIAAASRTSAASVARQCLQSLSLQDPKSGREISVMSLFKTLEIYPGSKLTHFRRLQASTDIPFDQMIFFDDEYRNSEVERILGPEFVLVEQGLDFDVVRQGVQSWRRRQRSGHV